MQERRARAWRRARGTCRIDARRDPRRTRPRCRSAATAAGPDDIPTPPSREPLAAFWLTLDAINFGSGWFPTLRKRAGRSGYSTIAAGVRERFERAGPVERRRS